MDDDREELLAAMYQGTETETEARSTRQIEPAGGFSRTRKIRVGVVEYEVPTIEYVKRLEQMLARQSAAIEQQVRQIERLKSFVVSTRNFIRRQTGRMAEMQTDIDGKLDYREYS